MAADAFFVSFLPFAEGYDIWYTPTLRPNSMGRLSILQGHLDIPAGATGALVTIGDLVWQVRIVQA